MTISLSRLWFAVGLLCISSLAWPADAPTKSFTLSKDAKGVITVAPKEVITLVATSDQPIDIKCDTAKSIDCTLYSLSYAQKTGAASGLGMTPVSETKADSKWTLPWAEVDKCQAGEVLISLKAGAAAAPVRIGVKPPPDASCPAVVAGAGGGGGSGTDDKSTESIPVQQLVATDCSIEISNVRSSYSSATDLYDEKANFARFVVTASGNVIARPDEAVDENDTVNVVVIADKKLLPKLNVKRSSTIRTLGALNIVGADVSVSSFGLKSKENPCGHQEFALADFAPGKGEVTISVAATQGATTTGTFEFTVSTLYSGAFSVGPMYTTLKDPSFGPVNKGAGNVVTETDRGSNRVIYTLMFTPFIWGKRDLEKDQLHSGFDWHRLNPMFGIVLNDVSNNAIVGVSYDLSSLVYLNLGAHFAKVKRLDPNSGLTVGGAFTGSGTAVPTQTQWKTGFFAGFSMDLRAAAKFFGLASSK